MNLLDAIVKEVLSEPHLIGETWCLHVSATCGSPVVYQKVLYFKTKEEALAVKPGWEFLT